jgi:hypothetical protein
MKKDRCVQCNRETQFDVDAHIDERGETYISGLGQLCYRCYKVTLGQFDNNNELICIPKETILEKSNDSELGEIVRKMFYESNTRI